MEIQHNEAEDRFFAYIVARFLAKNPNSVMPYKIMSLIRKIQKKRGGKQ